jgi:surface antigen
VHSWKGSQITEGRRATSSAAAMRGTMDGGSAMSDALVAQNLRNCLRETPRARRYSPSVDDAMWIPRQIP